MGISTRARPRAFTPRTPAPATGKVVDKRRTQGERTQMLELLDKAIKDIGTSAYAGNGFDLERETYYCVRTPDGRAMADFHIEGDDRDVVRSFTGFSIDRENDAFYINRWGDNYGPFNLPDGFNYDSLFPNTHKDPAARSKGAKVLKSLTKAISDQEPEVYGKPFVDMDWDSGDRTWRTPTGGKLHQAEPYDKRYRFGGASFFFDLRKKEFWLEQIPGVSGQAKGPYKLPKGFKKEDIALLDKMDYSSRANSRDSFSTSSTSSRRSSVIGGGGSGYSRPVGGGGSGGGRSVGGGGSGGSVRSFYIRSRGGGGGGS
jgi:hypothetical protein